MKILVTGAAGFIGSRVVQQLVAYPHLEITALVRASTDLWRLRACGLNPTENRLHLAYADLCDRSAVAAVLQEVQPDVLVHLAMAYHTLGSVGGKDVDTINLHATLELHRTFLDSGGRRFVAAGTCFEYGHHVSEQIDETVPCRPIYEYAIAKARATEAVLERGQRSGTEALILRVFAPYGSLEAPSRIVPQLLEAGLSGRRLELSPGEQVRDYVHVEDVATAFVLASLCPRLPATQAVYNVGSAVGHSVRQLAATVAEALGRPLDLHWGKLPYRPNEMMRLVSDNRRIQHDLGWQPLCPLPEGLARTARWLSEVAGQPARAA